MQPNSERPVTKSIPGDIPVWAPFAVLLFTGILYSRALLNGFTSFDDNAYILNNTFIRDLSWNGAKVIFTSFYAGNYHPLTMLTYLFEYTCFGTHPLPYHLMNVLLHLLNTWLVFKVAEQLNGKRQTALLVCILFAIHPMHVESVAWVAERKDVLYATFYFLALLLYLRYLTSAHSVGNYFITLMLFILSLLSKSAAVTFPVLLLAIDIYKGRTITAKALLEKIPFFLLSLLFGILNLYAQRADQAFNDLHAYGIVNRIFLFTTTLSFYLVKLAAPFHLSAMHFLPELHNGVLPGQYYTSFPFLLFLVLLLILMKRMPLKKEIIFGLAFFLITISVMLQIVAVGSMLTAERYTYIPYFGLFYIIGEWVSSIDIRKWRQLVIVGCSLPVIVFSAQTWSRIGVWKNDETLYADIREKRPGAARNVSYGFYMRADTKKNKGDLNGALFDYSQAILLNPKSENAYCSRGDIYRMSGNTALAIADFNKALLLNPNFAAAYNNLGGVYYSIGNIKSALANFNKAISLNPGFAEAYNNRGGALYHLGDTQSAVKDYNKAMLLKPDYAGAYNNRGTAYLDRGDTVAALADYNQAIALDPRNAESYNNRGMINMGLHDLKSAMMDYNKAIQLSPGYAAAYNNRGWAYYLSGNLQAALPDYDNAITLNPGYEPAYNNRGCAYAALGNFNAALFDYNKAISLNPKNVTAYYNLAAIKANTGDLHGALEAYDYFLNLAPNDNMGYNDRGTVRYNLKDIAGACSDWTKAATLGNKTAMEMVRKCCH